MGHPLETVNVWSRIRQEIAVIKLDNANPLYLAGLKSAIKEVDYEEHGEHFTSNGFEWDGISD
jgi:hypothetical protein